jgi:secondary thiamine-phosphate synthase enzyme
VSNGFAFLLFRMRYTKPSTKLRFGSIYLSLRSFFLCNKGKGNLRVFTETLTFSTKGEVEFVDLSDKVQEIVSRCGVKDGLVHVFAPHATGIIILTELDSGLLEDIKSLLEQIASSHGRFRHPSNAYAHLRSVLLPPDKTVPIVDGRVAFGTWQSLVFVETDVHPRRRSVIVQVLGE